jgi:regulator of protease activity HflC (stomatin/prohibitin superfamily)
MPTSLKVFGGVIVVVLIVALASIRTVGVGQVGIRTQFGRVIGEKQSGLTVVPPWQGMTKMNIQIQKEQQEAAAATHDLQDVNTTVALNYNLTSATANQVFREVGPDYKARIVDPILQESVKAVTSQYDATDLIDLRPAVEAKILTQLQNKLSQRGITVDNLSIVNFSFSADFSKAIEQKQVEAQNVQAAQYKLQQAGLNAQAQQSQATTLTPNYLELQAIQKWDGHLPNTVAGAGGGSILSIPLSK